MADTTESAEGELEVTLEDHARELSRTLRDAGAEPSTDLEASVDSYRRQCHERAEKLRESKRHDDLAQQLELRRDAETHAERARSLWQWWLTSFIRLEWSIYRHEASCVGLRRSLLKKNKMTILMISRVFTDKCAGS